MSNVVEGLEKRLNEGSLSKDETDDLIGSLENVVGALETHLGDTIEKDEVYGDFQSAIKEFDADKVAKMLDAGKIDLQIRNLLKCW